jgi:hypothetical protein
MNAPSGTIPRQNRRLCLARDLGYLDARRRDTVQLIQPFGLWCWRMKLPMVWFERRSPRSRFGHLHADLMTTAEELSPATQELLAGLGATVSASDAHWSHVPLADLPRLARTVFRELRHSVSYRRSRPSLTVISKVHTLKSSAA